MTHLSITEAAKLKNCAASTLYRDTYAGLVPTVEGKKPLKIDISSEAWQKWQPRGRGRPKKQIANE